MCLTFIQHTAEQGFPLTHRRIKEVVDEICRARLGLAFPESGVGHSWTDRFLLKHSDQLHPYWSHALDNAR
ncbi:hypothetical protein K474DRAFT_1582486, partial [Panus rudis PR-1116 ss-1]